MLIAYSGCLLPLLIVLNLFFGRLFFDTGHWLAIEGILILLFFFNSYISLRRVFWPGSKKRDGAIDVKGKVIK
ncbi:MAG: hypothetical protein Q7K98_08330 [Candidatus Omnitrophota bacterium]|nr:hypothetical protein [Candidatus Omnitrophota bacterium]